MYRLITEAKLFPPLFQVDEALTIKNTDIAKELNLPPVKLHCSSELLSITYVMYINFSFELCFHNLITK
jgi:hypothetical protein